MTYKNRFKHIILLIITIAPCLRPATNISDVPAVPPCFFNLWYPQNHINNNLVIPLWLSFLLCCTYTTKKNASLKTLACALRAIYICKCPAMSIIISKCARTIWSVAEPRKLHYKLYMIAATAAATHIQYLCIYTCAEVCGQSVFYMFFWRLYDANKNRFF